MSDQGWRIDDGDDEYEDWGDDGHDYDDEPDEPDWGCEDWLRECAMRGRRRRQRARRRAQDYRRWHKVRRHRNDRFWQARNRDAFDQEAPF